jgi:alanine racemase
MTELNSPSTQLAALHSAWLEIDLDALLHNYHHSCEQVRPAQIIPVVKANAEGFGLRVIARELEQAGADMLAVSHFVEAPHLREHGVTADLLIMNGLFPRQMEAAVDAGFEFFVFDEQSMRAANEAAGNVNKKARVHIKVDTGLGRLGIMPGEARHVARLLEGLPQLNVVGLASHLAAPDASEHDEFTRRQYELFLQAAEALDPNHELLWHIAASSAVLRFPEMHLDAVRVGKLSWGVTGQAQPDWCLKPIASYKTRLVQVKTLPPGHNVGYNMRFSVDGPTRCGILPLGVVDGLRVGHAQEGRVLVHGQRCPILAVCSCELMIDVTAVPEAAAGDEVVLFGCQEGAELPLPEFAEFAGGNYGSVSRKIASRLPRHYYRAGKLAAVEVFGRREL